MSYAGRCQRHTSSSILVCAVQLGRGAGRGLGGGLAGGVWRTIARLLRGHPRDVVLLIAFQTPLRSLPVSQ